MLQNSQKTHLCRSLFFGKFRPEGYNFTKKENLIQLLSFEFCENFKKTFFHRTAPVLLLETMVLRMKRILTLSWRKPLSYRNQSTDLQSKSIDWFLYNNGLRHERVNNIGLRIPALLSTKSVNASTSCHNLLQNTFINTRKNRYNRLRFRDIKTTAKNINHMTLKVLATNPHNYEVCFADERQLKTIIPK